jgi:hypothetical protein
MCPSLLNEPSFEQGLSNKLHNSLVIKNRSKAKHSTIKQPKGAITSTAPVFPLAPLTNEATLPLAKSNSRTAMLPMSTSCTSLSVSGTREKKRILEEYVSKFGTGYQECIITKKKGKPKINEDLYFLTSSWKGMKPSSDKYYRVKELTIYNVITIVIQEYTAFSKKELSHLHLINKDFSMMLPKLKHWLKIDFSLLRKPRLNYKNQTQINLHQVCMANAAMAHFGLDPGRFVRWMGGDYTGQL